MSFISASKPYSSALLTISPANSSQLPDYEPKRTKSVLSPSIASYYTSTYSSYYYCYSGWASSYSSGWVSTYFYGSGCTSS